MRVPLARHEHPLRAAPHPFAPWQ